jgi:hypothetical protein
MTVLKPVFLRADGARSFGSGDFLAIGEEVSSGARATILLEAGEVLHHDALLLTGDATATSFG